MLQLIKCEQRNISLYVLKYQFLSSTSQNVFTNIYMNMPNIAYSKANNQIILLKYQYISYFSNKYLLLDNKINSFSMRWIVSSSEVIR